MNQSLIEIKNLSISLEVAEQKKPLIKDVNLEIPPEKIVALVGGSGSGKTTTGLSILRLLPEIFHIDGGQILYKGQDLLGLPEEDMRGIRGHEIGMIFQEPLSAFNPVLTIGYQIDEVLAFHTQLNKHQRQDKVNELLGLVGLDSKRIVSSYAHQLSGGMRQRAMIAQAIAASPKLIIADEPTSSLDVTIQARILDLFRELREKLHLSILLITHDLGVVEHLSDQIYVMKDGRTIESGPTKMIFSNPKEEYTQALIQTTRV